MMKRRMVLTLATLGGNPFPLSQEGRLEVCRAIRAFKPLDPAKKETGLP